MSFADIVMFAGLAVTFGCLLLVSRLHRRALAQLGVARDTITDLTNQLAEARTEPWPAALALSCTCPVGRNANGDICVSQTDPDCPVHGVAHRTFYSRAWPYNAESMPTMPAYLIGCTCVWTGPDLCLEHDKSTPPTPAYPAEPLYVRDPSPTLTDIRRVLDDLHEAGHADPVRIELTRDQWDHLRTDLEDISGDDLSASLYKDKAVLGIPVYLTDADWPQTDDERDQFTRARDDHYAQLRALYRTERPGQEGLR